MHLARGTTLPIFALGALVGCGTTPEATETCPHGDAPYWRHIHAPDRAWQSPDDSVLENNVFWNEGELWIWGEAAAGIWSLGAHRWRDIPEHAGSRETDSPLVRVAAHQLIVFGGYEKDVFDDSPPTVMKGWRFSEAEGWRPMSTPPTELPHFVDGAITSANQFFSFSYSSDDEPFVIGSYDPAKDSWQTRSALLPPGGVPGKSRRTWTPTPRGWLSGLNDTVFYDESTEELTLTTAGDAQVALAGEQVIGFYAGRFDFDQRAWAKINTDGFSDDMRLISAGSYAAVAPNSPVSARANPADNLSSDWKLYEPNTDEWTTVPRQCEPEAALRFAVATDYGLLVWTFGTDEDPYGEGRLLVLPDSLDLPE